MGSVTPIPGSCFPLVFPSPSLSGQMPDAVTPAPGSCLPFVSLYLPVSVVRYQNHVSRLSPCVSQWSDARCCDAGSGVVSPACLPVSQSLLLRRWLRGRVSVCLPVSPSLCGQMTLFQFARSDARCCDAGCRVVSCGQMSGDALPVSQML